ncbi:MAG: glycosyltransferase family 2 protein [Candidatus Eisenbacteria bacterium]|nr:glycosyltransferase family 2 protein [Candidatus Eisenbacteria bacterium]
MKSFLSIVCPVLNEEESIPGLVDEICEVLEPLQPDRIEGYEIIFVDDGSTDGTRAVLERLHGEKPQLGVIRFRTNVGKSAALARGFRAARGDVVVTMDGDLQDDPHEIPLLLDKLDEGFHAVSGWKAERKDPLSKRLPSRIYNWATRLASGLPLHDFNCGLKAYRREVVEEVRVYGQLHRFLPVLAHWRGFRVGEIRVRHRPRRFGRSKFGASRFVAGLLDFMTVVFLMKYRRRPLHLFGFVGLALFGLGVLVNLYLAVIWLQTHAIGGRPLLIFGLLSTILGFQFISIGLLGEMMVHLLKSEDDAPVENRLAPRGGDR